MLWSKCHPTCPCFPPHKHCLTLLRPLNVKHGLVSIAVSFIKTLCDFYFLKIFITISVRGKRDHLQTPASWALMSIFVFNYNKSKDHHEFDKQYNKVELFSTICLFNFLYKINKHIFFSLTINEINVLMPLFASILTSLEYY